MFIFLIIYLKCVSDGIVERQRKKRFTKIIWNYTVFTKILNIKKKNIYIYIYIAFFVFLVSLIIECECHPKGQKNTAFVVDNTNNRINVQSELLPRAYVARIP